MSKEGQNTKIKEKNADTDINTDRITKGRIWLLERKGEGPGRKRRRKIKRGNRTSQNKWLK